MKKRNAIVFMIIFILLIISFKNFDNIKFLISMVDIYISDKEVVDEELGPEPPINPLEQFNDDSLSKKHPNTSDIEEEINKGDIAEENTNSLKVHTIEDISKAHEINENKNKNPEANVELEDPDFESKDISLEDIANRYNLKFQNLQSEFLTSLDNLIADAGSEYVEKKSSNTQIASKYISKASSLEKSCDNKMDTILKELKSELVANNHETNLVKEIKDYYGDFKRNKKSDLLSSAKEHL